MFSRLGAQTEDGPAQSCNWNHNQGYQSCRPRWGSPPNNRRRQASAAILSSLACLYSWRNTNTNHVSTGTIGMIHTRCNVPAEFLAQCLEKIQLADLCYLHGLYIPLVGYSLPKPQAAEVQTQSFQVELPSPVQKSSDKYIIISIWCAKIGKLTLAPSSSPSGKKKKKKSIHKWVRATCPSTKSIKEYIHIHSQVALSDTCEVRYQILTCWWLRLSS